MCVSPTCHLQLAVLLPGLLPVSCAASIKLLGRVRRRADARGRAEIQVSHPDDGSLGRIALCGALLCGARCRPLRQQRCGRRCGRLLHSRADLRHPSVSCICQGSTFCISASKPRRRHEIWVHHVSCWSHSECNTHQAADDTWSDQMVKAGRAV